MPGAAPWVHADACSGTHHCCCIETLGPPFFLKINKASSGCLGPKSQPPLINPPTLRDESLYAPASPLPIRAGPVHRPRFHSPHTSHTPTGRTQIHPGACACARAHTHTRTIHLPPSDLPPRPPKQPHVSLGFVCSAIAEGWESLPPCKCGVLLKRWCSCFHLNVSLWHCCPL